MLNFDSRLEEDLKKTSAEFIRHMKSHSLLSDNNLALMRPLERAMARSFEKLRQETVPANKNYFALSLKDFFQSLTDDLLDLLCHNYVHDFIAEYIEDKAKLIDNLDKNDKK